MTSYQIIGLLFAISGVLAGLSLLWESQKVKSLDLDYLPKTNLLVWVVRIFVGLLFLYSGYVKANDYIGFAYKLEEYFGVFASDFSLFKGFFEFMTPLSKPLAWFISVFEMALGVAVIVGWRMNLTMWLSMLMMIFFTILTGYSHYTGAVADCGCFGDALKIEPWESFVKDIILTGMLIPVFVVRHSIHPIFGKSGTWKVVLASFLLAGAYSYYCHEHLPVVDYRAYKVGVDLEHCKEYIAPGDDFPKCSDFDQFYSDRELPIFEGNNLMVVIYTGFKADMEDMQASEALYQSLQGSGINVYGANGDSKKTFEEEIKPKAGMTYPFTYFDPKTLKTIVRSNPGYVLLKEGVVVEKWHHNDIPSADEVKALLQ